MTLNDPLCEECPNKIMKCGKDKKLRCPALCLPMMWVNGRASRKENLLKEPLKEREYEDYNQVLARLIAQKKENHIEEIRNISDITMRAVAAMLWADISITEISKLTHTHRATFYKKIATYINNNK